MEWNREKGYGGKGWNREGGYGEVGRGVGRRDKERKGQEWRGAVGRGRGRNREEGCGKEGGCMGVYFCH